MTKSSKPDKKKMIIAEDDTVLALLLKFKLENAGYIPLVAGNGKEALELIKKHQPDLVLCDILMPLIDGLEVLSHVRNKMKLQTPFIMFSVEGQEETVMKAFSLGANDFVSKPFSPNELLIRINKMLQ